MKKENRCAPLLRRNRNERVAGLERAVDILSELKKEAEKKINAIRKAKALAASL